MWFRQMAQLSTTMSHAQSATAFHFLTSKRFLSPSTPVLVLALAALALAGGASAMSTSAMVGVGVSETVERVSKAGGLECGATSRGKARQARVKAGWAGGGEGGECSE